MFGQIRIYSLVSAGLCLAYVGLLTAPDTAFASDEAIRNKLARQDCVRGKFKDYYLQGRGGDPSPDYKGRVFKLSQDYPTQLPPKESYPWEKIGFKNGGPVDPVAYLRALLDYGLEGNIGVDFYVQDNKVRKWYGMPWMDWNTEVATDWPGTDGREFVHGLTHEFDSDGNTFGEAQAEFVDTWAQAYVNDRYAFSIGQVYCDPDDPKPAALNPDPTGLNSMPDGAYVIKLLFSTVNETELPTVKGALEWDADIYANKSPTFRNAGPFARFAPNSARSASSRSIFRSATTAAPPAGCSVLSVTTAMPRAIRRGNGWCRSDSNGAIIPR